MLAPRAVARPPGADDPAPPEGWHTGPPDYVGVGTAGSGANWWHSHVDRHPQVARVTGRPEALHHFDDGWQQGLDEKLVERYRARFPRPSGAVAGEWTPEYLQQAWTPALLRRAAPDARLLVMLRDPVERFRADRAAAMERQENGSTPRAAANAAFSRGLYADQLLRLWRAFPREQVLVLQYEQCVVDPRGQLERTMAFIGLASESQAPDALEGAGLEGAGLEGAGTGLSEWQADQLARHYAPENERLATLLPDIDPSLWRAPR